MKVVSIVPVGWPVSLRSCPPGLFCAIGPQGPRTDCLGLKTEYQGPGGGTEAFVVASGEAWWGEAPQTLESRESELVMACAIHVGEAGE